MTRFPEYLREGWRTAGPGGCRCPHCGATVTTNALGRASHRQACKGWQEFRDRLRGLAGDPPAGTQVAIRAPRKAEGSP